MIAPAETIKSLLAAPYTQRDVNIAVQKVGSTIVLESIENPTPPYPHTPSGVQHPNTQTRRQRSLSLTASQEWEIGDGAEYKSDDDEVEGCEENFEWEWCSACSMTESEGTMPEWVEEPFSAGDT